MNDEKIKKSKEIIDLKNKLVDCDKFKEEIEKIKNKYSLLEKQITEKDMTIDKLMDSNNDLKDKLEISNQNYNRVMNEQKDLEIKLNNLVETLNKYQEIFQRKLHLKKLMFIMEKYRH